MGMSRESTRCHSRGHSVRLQTGPPMPAPRVSAGGWGAVVDVDIVDSCPTKTSDGEARTVAMTASSITNPAALSAFGPYLKFQMQALAEVGGFTLHPRGL
jgi:hypothetical protein